jgi:hypothetical protein
MATPEPSHQTVKLSRGRHISPEDGVCVMELASMLAGVPFTDHPASVCRVIAAVLRGCNDRFDDGTRQCLYRYASDAVRTAGDRAATVARLRRCVEAVQGRTRPRGLARLLRRPLLPPEDPTGRGLEAFVAEVVASFPRTPEGAERLLALVDDLLAIGPAAPPPAPPRRIRALSSLTAA